MKTIAEIRLSNARRLLSSRGMSMSMFARDAGMSLQQVSAVIGSNPSRNIGEQLARRIEEFFGRPNGWLDHNHWQARWNPPTEDANVSLKPSKNALDGLATIPHLNISLGPMAADTPIEADHDREPYVVSQSFLARMRIDPKSTAVMFAAGSGMAPRIEDGDLMLVDCDDTAIASGKVYLVNLGGEASIKRLFRRPDGGVRVVSDNLDKTRYPDWELGSDGVVNLRVIARVSVVVGPL
jgi:transcriptional regulator with XRE-family HTH domain